MPVTLLPGFCERLLQVDVGRLVVLEEVLLGLVQHDLGEGWIQSLAEDFGATGPVNGSWIQALALEIQKNADLIDLLLARVNAEGGVFEAELCLEEQLNALEI